MGSFKVGWFLKMPQLTFDIPTDIVDKVKSVSTGLFNDGFVPIMDGVTITVKNYAYWLNRTLGPTYVVTPFVPNYTDAETFPVIRFLSMPTIVRPPYRIGLPDFDLRLQYILKNRDFDIVHAHSPFSAGLLARRVAKLKRIPIVATFHSKYRDDLERAIAFKPIVKDQVKRIVDFYYSVDHVWVPQESVAATLREYGYKGPYEVVENGIDIQPVDDISAFRKRGAAELGFADGTPVGLYVGQHIFEKNLEFLVRSLPGIMREVPEFRMVFVGRGYAKTKLQDLAKELKIDGKVLFHDVVYDRELLKAIYARGDIFLFPSLYDNAPLVVREAAAFKTPSVLIRGATAAEVIVDGENGFLSENSVDAFVARVVWALSHSEDLRRVSENAQKTLCRTWEDVVREVKVKYLDILSHWAS
jgi:glycosyltransferase involved in cell wall biosynthesis